MTPTLQLGGTESSSIPNYSLHGGPINRIGDVFHPLTRKIRVIATGVAIGTLLWSVLMGLAFMEGLLSKTFHISLVAIHVRLLVAIPLFFLCEAWVEPVMTTFVHMLVKGQTITKEALPGLEREIKCASHLRDSKIPELACLLLAAGFLISSPNSFLAGASSAIPQNIGFHQMTWAATWYWYVCLTVFRFLLLRCIWKLAQWTLFLWRVSQLDLRLLPTHPDGVGGLGYLEVVHARFAPAVLAISAVQCAGLTEDLVTGRIYPSAAYMTMVLVITAEAVLFLGPLCMFWSRLRRCREKGLADYMVFAAQYVSDFDRKWLYADTGHESLGTTDIQSLADLNNSVSIIRTMRLAPISRRLLISLSVAAAAPTLGLILLIYPFEALAMKIISALLGL